jgi:hypothetical protein
VRQPIAIRMEETLTAAINLFDVYRYLIRKKVDG